MKRSIAAALTVALVGCGGAESPEDAAAPPDTTPPPPAVETPPAWEGEDLQIRLVDSIAWRTELASGVHRRVAVRHEGVVDTLDEVAVDGPPTIVGDSALYGFDWSDGDVARGFRWEPGDEIRTIELPDDFLGFTAFSLAPDGAHLAYVGEASESPDGEIRLKAVVREWPGNESVWESHPVAGYPSGETNSVVDWPTADSVRIRIRLDDLETPGGSWLRVSGSPSTASFAADTVSGG